MGCNAHCFIRILSSCQWSNFVSLVRFYCVQACEYVLFRSRVIKVLQYKTININRKTKSSKKWMSIFIFGDDIFSNYLIFSYRCTLIKANAMPKIPVNNHGILCSYLQSSFVFAYSYIVSDSSPLMVVIDSIIRLTLWTLF